MKKIMSKNAIRISIVSIILSILVSCEKDYEMTFSSPGVPVDMGLSVKWASCNVGAYSPEESGDRFAWGEVMPKKNYSKENYTYHLDPAILPPNADAATANWGGKWRMPTEEEWRELLYLCTWTETRLDNGLLVCMVTSKLNGNSIFLPYGIYWSRSRFTHYQFRDEAGCIYLFKDDRWLNYYSRYWGHSVRPVYVGVVDATLPEVAISVSQNTISTALVTHSVVFNGNDAIIERGFSLSTQPNATMADTTIVLGNEMGSLTYELKNLQKETTYYIRAYATNTIGTTYKEITFRTCTGIENGYTYVDLGLPSGLKWATYNIGASKPEEFGDYFAWGEVEPKETYDWSSYKWNNGSEANPFLTKYCVRVDNKTLLDKEDDAAVVNWGGCWRMPTKAELDQLCGHCTWIWTSLNGVNGYMVTGSTGNSIFLPAAGYRFGSSLKYAGSRGLYWSSSLFTDNPYYAYVLDFNSDLVDWSSSRCCGQSVRPVCQ